MVYGQKVTHLAEVAIGTLYRILEAADRLDIFAQVNAAHLAHDDAAREEWMRAKSELVAAWYPLKGKLIKMNLMQHEGDPVVQNLKTRELLMELAEHTKVYQGKEAKHGDLQYALFMLRAALKQLGANLKHRGLHESGLMVMQLREGLEEARAHLATAVSVIEYLQKYHLKQGILVRLSTQRAHHVRKTRVKRHRRASLVALIVPPSSPVTSPRKSLSGSRKTPSPRRRSHSTPRKSSHGSPYKHKAQRSPMLYSRTAALPYVTRRRK